MIASNDVCFQERAVYLGKHAWMELDATVLLPLLRGEIGNDGFWVIPVGVLTPLPPLFFCEEGLAVVESVGLLPERAFPLELCAAQTAGSIFSRRGSAPSITTSGLGSGVSDASILGTASIAL
jgi:hypothetical protein